MKTKKDARMELRIPSDSLRLFDMAIERAKKDRPDVIRELMDAAVTFINQNNGKWYTPRLVADAPPAAPQTLPFIANPRQSAARVPGETRARKPSL
jgi:hypothetical protein